MIVDETDRRFGNVQTAGTVGGYGVFSPETVAGIEAYWNNPTRIIFNATAAEVDAFMRGPSGRGEASVQVRSRSCSESNFGSSVCMTKTFQLHYLICILINVIMHWLAHHSQTRIGHNATAQRFAQERVMHSEKPQSRPRAAQSSITALAFNVDRMRQC